MEQDTIYIYLLIPRMDYFFAVFVRQLYTKAQNSDCFETPKDSEAPKKM